MGTVSIAVTAMGSSLGRGRGRAGAWGPHLCHVAWPAANGNCSHCCDSNGLRGAFTSTDGFESLAGSDDEECGCFC